MILKLLKRRPRSIPRAPAAPAVPQGTLLWAVGDIHGCLDLLKPLVEAILAEAESAGAARKIVVFLGDYVDRGPASQGVLQYLAELSHTPGIEWRFLKGNHEEAMLNFLTDPTAGARWCEYGGDAALLSYGLRPPNLRHRAEGWIRVSADLKHKLSAPERSFLEGLEFSVAVGDYFFAHAGARPGEPLERQTTRDLMWIRNSFLDSDVGFEKVIVHGHTPTREVHADHRRIGVDTKAYESGILTALRLEGQDRSVVQAVCDGSAVHIRKQRLEHSMEPAGV